MTNCARKTRLFFVCSFAFVYHDCVCTAGTLPWQHCNFACEIINYRWNLVPKWRSNLSHMIIALENLAHISRLNGDFWKWRFLEMEDLGKRIYCLPKLCRGIWHKRDWEREGTILLLLLLLSFITSYHPLRSAHDFFSNRVIKKWNQLPLRVRNSKVSMPLSWSWPL